MQEHLTTQLPEHPCRHRTRNDNVSDGLEDATRDNTIRAVVTVLVCGRLSQWSAFVFGRQSRGRPQYEEVVSGGLLGNDDDDDDDKGNNDSDDKE